MSTRSQKDGFWLWASKHALAHIRQYCDDPASATAVYIALCEIASDERDETFDASHSYIAGKCHLSRRTVIRRLEELENISLVRVKRSGHLKTPSRYTLLQCASMTQRCATEEPF